jgi:hypothetical protein
MAKFPYGSKYNVRRTTGIGMEPVGAYFKTLQDAIAYGRDLADRYNADVWVYKEGEGRVKKLSPMQKNPGIGKVAKKGIAALKGLPGKIVSVGKGTITMLMPKGSTATLMSNPGMRKRIKSVKVVGGREVVARRNPVEGYEVTITTRYGGQQREEKSFAKRSEVTAYLMAFANRCVTSAKEGYALVMKGGETVFEAAFVGLTGKWTIHTDDRMGVKNITIPKQWRKNPDTRFRLFVHRTHKPKVQTYDSSDLEYLKKIAATALKEARVTSVAVLDRVEDKYVMNQRKNPANPGAKKYFVYSPDQYGNDTLGVYRDWKEAQQAVKGASQDDYYGGKYRWARLEGDGIATLFYVNGKKVSSAEFYRHVKETKGKNPAKKRVGRRKNPSHEAKDLFYYAINNAQLMRQRIAAIIANLKKKVAKGQYDSELAVKAWKFAADDAAQRYTKEFDSDNRTTYGIFTVPMRTETAKLLRDHFEDEVKG